LGASEKEITDSKERRTHDRCATLESQLEWLREAGFTTADCVYKYWELAVLLAVRKGTA
jgi:tRNA (cmo5U34)-methyltransferase